MGALKLQLADDLLLDLNDYAQTGWRVGVWASSGRGKSYAVGVIVEELLDAGIPVVAIDPEGELWTLREKYRTLVVGGPHGDLPATSSPAAIRKMLEMASEQRLALVFDLSEFSTNAEQQARALPVLQELFSLQTRQRRTMALVIEEVQIFVPEGAKAVTAEVMNRISKLGRKRGILLIVASQRTQSVSKEFISSINFPLIGGFEEIRDFEHIKHHAAGKTFAELHNLPVGSFWFPKIGSVHRIRTRKVTHGGDTPDLTGEIILRETVKDRSLDETIAALATVIAAEKEKEEAEASELARLRSRVRELEEQIRAKDEEIRQLNIALKVAASAAGRHAGDKDEHTLEKTSRVEAVMVEAENVEVHQQPQPSRKRAAAPKVRPAGPKPAAKENPIIRKEPASTAVSLAYAPQGLPQVHASPEDLMQHEAVQQLLKKAMDMTRRKLGGYENYCALALAVMVRGARLVPEEMALGLGLASQSSVSRIKVACRMLAKNGLAIEQRNGTFILDENKLKQAVALWEARRAAKALRKRK